MRLLFSLIVVVVFLLLMEPPAGAFKVGRDENGKVVVFDNDYLDRRFGRTWVPGRGAIAGDERARIEEQPNQVRPNRPLASAISRATSPRQAAALRLAETGRASLQNGQHQKAVLYFEKALGVDASPFMHFYLARAYYELGEYQRSLRFLEVAESALNAQTEWRAELETLRRELAAIHPAELQAAQSRVSEY
jgi:tetratricopeptide (TPR) repeat protein